MLHEHFAEPPTLLFKPQTPLAGVQQVIQTPCSSRLCLITQSCAVFPVST